MNNIKVIILTFLFLSLLTVLITSCKKEEETELEMAATSIALLSGDNQTAEVETTLANKIGVIIKDQEGNE